MWYVVPSSIFYCFKDYPQKIIYSKEHHIQCRPDTSYMSLEFPSSILYKFIVQALLQSIYTYTMYLALFYTNFIMYFHNHCLCPYKWLRNTLSVYNSGRFKFVSIVFLFYCIMPLLASFPEVELVGQRVISTFYCFGSCCYCIWSPKEINHFFIFSWHFYLTAIGKKTKQIIQCRGQLTYMIAFLS